MWQQQGAGPPQCHAHSSSCDHLWELPCPSPFQVLTSRLVDIIQHHAHPAIHVLLLPIVLQDLGEPLAALLPYPEREQLVAVSLDGTAWVLSRPADASHAKASRSSVGGAFMWTCALRMVLAKASEDNPLAVRPGGGGGGGGEGSSAQLGRGSRQWKAQAHGQEGRKQLVVPGYGVLGVHVKGLPCEACATWSWPVCSDCSMGGVSPKLAGPSLLLHSSTHSCAADDLLPAA